MAAVEAEKKKSVMTQAAIDKRKGLVDQRHKYLLEKFLPLTDTKMAELENSFILGNKLELVNEFFKEGGTKRVFFFWQASKVPLICYDK